MLLLTSKRRSFVARSFVVRPFVVAYLLTRSYVVAYASFGLAFGLFADGLPLQDALEAERAPKGLHASYARFPRPGASESGFHTYIVLEYCNRTAGPAVTPLVRHGCA